MRLRLFLQFLPIALHAARCRLYVTPTLAPPPTLGGTPPHLHLLDQRQRAVVVAQHKVGEAVGLVHRVLRWWWRQGGQRGRLSAAEAAADVQARLPPQDLAQPV